MILTVQQGFELDLPVDWREIPPVRILTSDLWLHEWVDELPITGEHKEGFLRSLERAAGFVISEVSAPRAWVAILDRVQGIVRAMASITAIDLTGVAFRDYPALGAPDDPIEGAIVWAAQHTEAVLAGHPAIVLHTVGAYNVVDGGGPVIAERYVGTVFPGAGSTAVQLEVLTEDLGAFEDIVATGNAVLDGLRFALDVD